MRFLLPLVLLLLCVSTSAATSVVALRSGDEIVIGADSKMILSSARSGAGHAAGKCKIIQKGDLFFASAGFTGMQSKGSQEIAPDLDVGSVIRQCLDEEGGLPEKVARLEKVLGLQLTEIAEKALQENPAFFVDKFLKAPAHTIIIAGIDGVEPVLMVRTFRLISSPSGDLSVQIGRFTCPGDCGSDPITVFEGKSSAIREYLATHEHFLDSTDPVSAVRRLVGIEIDQEPASVGPPVDILRITSKGTQWIQRKPLCPDIVAARRPEREASTPPSISCADISLPRSSPSR